MNSIVFADNVESFEPFKGYSVVIALKAGEVQSDGEKIGFGGGDIIVIPPLKNAEFFCKGLFSVRIEKALLQFDEVKIFRDDENFGIAHAARQAKQYINSNADILACLGNLLVGYICSADSKKPLSPVVQTVKNEIDKNLSLATFSLEDYLKSLPLNYDYMRKLFKKETGATPHEYLIHSRMELARGLIAGGISNRYTSYSVAQIAEACGFSEPLYFSRVFKKYFGVAPSEYKK